MQLNVREYESSSIAALGRSNGVGSLDRGTALGSQKPLVLVLTVRHVVFDQPSFRSPFWILLFHLFHHHLLLFRLFLSRISVRATSLSQTRPIRLRRRRIHKPR